MTSRELLEILRGFRGLNLVGADVVEVSPAYDHAEITGVAASHVAYDLVSLLALARRRHDRTQRWRPGRRNPDRPGCFARLRHPRPACARPVRRHPAQRPEVRQLAGGEQLRVRRRRLQPRHRRGRRAVPVHRARRADGARRAAGGLRHRCAAARHRQPGAALGHGPAPRHAAPTRRSEGQRGQRHQEHRHRAAGRRDSQPARRRLRARPVRPGRTRLGGDPAGRAAGGHHRAAGARRPPPRSTHRGPAARTRRCRCGAAEFGAAAGHSGRRRCSPLTGWPGGTGCPGRKARRTSGLHGRRQGSHRLRPSAVGGLVDRGPSHHRPARGRRRAGGRRYRDGRGHQQLLHLRPPRAADPRRRRSPGVGGQPPGVGDPRRRRAGVGGAGRSR